MSDITKKEILDRFYIDFNGDFIYREQTGRIKAGTKAGTIGKRGYTRISINKKVYYAHRLVWFIETGSWPKGQIDHIDGNRSNNIFENLRDTNNSGNSKNSVGYGTSRAKNVFWNKNRKTWLVQMGVNGKYIVFGTYSDFELAELIAYEMREKYHKNFCNHKHINF